VRYEKLKARGESLRKAERIEFKNNAPSSVAAIDELAPKVWLYANTNCAADRSAINPHGRKAQSLPENERIG
jgi:hypothetical protein